MNNKTICTWCYKEFSYTDDDIKFYEETGWYDANTVGIKITYFVICPHCKKEVGLTW